jgi:hypothetical protein
MRAVEMLLIFAGLNKCGGASDKIADFGPVIVPDGSRTRNTPTKIRCEIICPNRPDFPNSPTT